MKKQPAPRGFQTDRSSVDACNIQIAYEKKLQQRLLGPYESLKTPPHVCRQVKSRLHYQVTLANPYPDAKLV
ncbi:hypothetical protein OH492_14635 [Vibrio chagasii]|nr:hypothetical protein [Vibrio chagasii]